MLKKVLVAQKVSEEALQMLNGKAEVVFSPAPDEETIAGLIPDCDAMLIRTATKLSEKTLKKAKKLVVISRTGTGVDNIDVEAATRLNIWVCNTPNSNSETVAEHTLSLMLTLAKNLVVLNEQTKLGNWGIRDQAAGFDLQGKKLGLIGFGRIGQAVALRAQAFGMEIHYFDPMIKNYSGPVAGLAHQTIQEVLALSQIVSLHLPLLESTRGLIGETEISLMQPGGILINTSRGGLVNETALLNGLKTGQLRGAGLDVFAHEPLLASELLCQEKRLIVTPHIAALTLECKARVAKDAVRNILDFLAGNKPTFIVNPTAKPDFAASLNKELIR